MQLTDIHVLLIGLGSFAAFMLLLGALDEGVLDRRR